MVPFFSGHITDLTATSQSRETLLLDGERSGDRSIIHGYKLLGIEPFRTDPDLEKGLSLPSKTSPFSSCRPADNPPKKLLPAPSDGATSELTILAEGPVGKILNETSFTCNVDNFLHIRFRPKGVDPLPRTFSTCDISTERAAAYDDMAFPIFPYTEFEKTCTGQLNGRLGGRLRHR